MIPILSTLASTSHLEMELLAVVLGIFPEDNIDSNTSTVKTMIILKTNIILISLFIGDI